MAADREGDARERIDGLVGPRLVGWVDLVARRARLVLVLACVLTLPVGVYAALSLGIDTSHRALLSEDLDFWEDYNAFAEVFPILDEALLVVIDGETPDRARDAAMALAARLEVRGDVFRRIYVPGGGEFFERHALLYLSVEELQDLGDNLASVQPLLAELMRDRSLQGLARILDRGIEVAESDPALATSLTDAFDSLSIAAQAVLEGNPRPVSWIELLLDREVPGESSRRLVVAEPELDYRSLLPARQGMEAVRRAAEDLGLEPARGVRVRITGNPALNYEEMVHVARQATSAAALSLVLVGIILWLSLGSLRLTLAMVGTLMLGLVWTAAFAAASVGYVNVISVAFAVLFIGLGVDFGIHLTLRYAELVRVGWEHRGSLEETARSVGGSLVLCALTTAIGFYVFLPTDYRAVAELGLVAGTGMLISLAATFTLLPALLSLGDTRYAGADRRAPRWFREVLVPLSVRRTRLVLWAALVVGILAAVSLPRVSFDHNVARLRDPSTESAQAFEELLAESETSPWTIDIRAESLAEARDLALRLRELDVVEDAVTLADYVPENQDEKLAVLEDLVLFLPGPVSYPPTEPRAPIEDQISALRALRESISVPWLAGGEGERAEAARRAVRYLDRFLARLEAIGAREDARVLEDFEQSLVGTLPGQIQRLVQALDPDPVALEDLPEDLSRRMLAPDGSARVEVRPAEDLSETAAHARFVDRVRAVAPEATGSAVTLLEWSRAVVRSFQQALASALLAITVVLWLLWRRLREVALVLVPLLLAAALTGAAAGWLGIRFNFANIVVLPLLLGIGVDSGIHLVHRYRMAPPSEKNAGHELLGTSTAHAVLFSALTTAASFGTLTLSSHRGISTLGQLLLLGVLAMLLANLVVLPALLAGSERRTRKARATLEA